MCGQLRNDIYKISQSVSIMYMTNKHPRVNNVADTYLWHCRHGHNNKNRMNRLTKEGIFEVHDCESLQTYESCLLKMMTKSSFTEKSERANDVLSLVHTDVLDP